MSQSHYVNMDAPGPVAAGGAARDPFYVVKDNMQASLRTLQIDFEKAKDLLESSNSNTPQYKSKVNNLKSLAKKLKSDLSDLNKTIEIVEANRARFPDIDDAELERRKQFISATKATLLRIANDLNSTTTKMKQEADKARAPKAPSAEEKQRSRDETAYIEDRASQQQQIVANQDLVLTDIESALVMLGDAATTMDTELTTQNDLLKDFNDEIDDTQGDMDRVMKKIEKLLGTSDKGKLLCILFLFIIVVILFFIIIYA